MPYRRTKYPFILILIALILVVVGAVLYAYNKQSNTFSDADKVNAQSVGDEFMADVQNNDSQAALKLSTPGFQEHPSSYIKDSSLQRFQSKQKATSSDLTFTPAGKGNPATAKATYTTYISVKDGQESHYTMTLQKVNGSWLVSGFDILP